MYGDWLKVRQPFEELFKDPQSATNKLIDLVSSERFLPCLFIGSKDHWANSIKYSFEGEIGFTLWGSADRSSSSGIYDRYMRGYTSSEPSAFTPQLHKALVSVFRAVDLGVLGFGVVTDVGYDAMRNFIGWKEGANKYWVFRYRIKVFWLHDSIRKNPSDVSKWQGENPQLRGVNNQGNNCYKEDNREAIESFKAFVLSKKDEILQTLEFYARLTQQKALPIQQQPEVVSQDLICSTGKDLPLSSLGDSLLGLLKAALKQGNVLLVGPPGTGKTSLALKLVRELTGNDACFEVTTANSLWFRRDLIGGESLRDNSIIWKAGLLIRAYVKASRIKEGNYYVIIDELNRADVDKAFGELFTIFYDNSPENWFIPSSIVEEIESYKDKVDDYASKFLETYKSMKNEPLRRIRIIGTMNLVDARNLFYVGEALTRRFTVFFFDYPSDASDVDNLLKQPRYSSLTQKERDDIKDLVQYLRERFSRDRRDRGQGVRFNVSPASVKAALDIYSSLDRRDVEAFIRALRGALGTLNEEVLKRFDDYVKEWREGRSKPTGQPAQQEK